MKKLLVLLSALMLIISSCSDDDNNNTDPFIGTWKLTKVTQDGQEVSLDECSFENTVTAFEDGIFSFKEYDVNNDNACYVSDVESGLWQNLGDSMYRFTFNPDTVEEYIEDFKITFSGNTFTIDYKEEGSSGVYTRQ